MRPLPNFSPCVVEPGSLDFAIPFQFNDCPAIFGCAERETYIFKRTRKSDPTLQMRATGHIFQVTLGTSPAFFTLHPTCCFRADGCYFLDADAFGQRCSNGQQTALVQQVTHPNFDRIHPQCLSQLIHLRFGRESSLRTAKAAKCAVWDIVGVNRIGIHFDVRDFVRPGAHQGGIPEYLGGGISISAAIRNHLNLGSDHLAVPGRAPGGVKVVGVAFVMPDNRLFPRPDRFYRPIDTALVQLPGSQRQDDLHRHILATAKGAADGRVDDAYFFFGQAECMGYLLAVFMRPLPADHNGHDPTFVYKADAGFRLKVGVLLGWRFIIPFDNHISLG